MRVENAGARSRRAPASFGLGGLIAACAVVLLAGVVLGQGLGELAEGDPPGHAGLTRARPSLPLGEPNDHLGVHVLTGEGSRY